MRITDVRFVQGFIRMCSDGWEQGWHERNGGNLSYRIKPEEMEEVKDHLKKDGEWRETGASVPALSGESFLVTGSGKYFRNVILDPEDNLCIIELDEKGERYRILWGLKNGGRPTSELPSHLSRLMKQYDVVVWAHHGMFCSGEDFDQTFGLMHTVEKSAEILVKLLSMRPDKLQTITPQDFRDLAADFQVTLPEKFLYEKP